jgi:long-chain acyl-CoA synthetase
VTNGFGQTELAGVVLFRGLGGPSIGGAGRPSSLAEVEVVDADDVPVAPGDTGEIVVRGPMVMNGYHRRPELTAHRHRGGWHHTHDLGRRETDGSISFVGPVTRIIKSAAENIYPAEVEGCLRGHPAVREAGVIGVPDPTWGQSVVAVVAFEEGASATPEDLVAHCRERIASYKKPKRVEVVDALPRTEAGGIDHAALDATYGGGGYPSR